MPEEQTPVTTAATTGAAATTATATAATTGAATPATVTLTSEQYQVLASFQTQNAELRAAQQQRDDAARQLQLDAMARQGEVDRALRETREDAERRVNIERTNAAAEAARGRRYAVDNELTRHLAGHALVPNGVDQLTQLWRNQFSAEPNGDTFNVRTAGGQSAGDFIAAQLATPAYAHFRVASTQGGAGAGGAAQQTDPTPGAVSTTDPVPKTLGEAVIFHMQNLKNKKTTDARVDMTSSFGLRRTQA